MRSIFCSFGMFSEFFLSFSNLFIEFWKIFIHPAMPNTTSVGKQNGDSGRYRIIFLLCATLYVEHNDWSSSSSDAIITTLGGLRHPSLSLSTSSSPWLIPSSWSRQVYRGRLRCYPGMLLFGYPSADADEQICRTICVHSLYMTRPPKPTCFGDRWSIWFSVECIEFVVVATWTSVALYIWSCLLIRSFH